MYRIKEGNGLLPEIVRVLDYSDWTEEKVSRDELIKSFKSGSVSVDDFCNLRCMSSLDLYMVSTVSKLFVRGRRVFNAKYFKFIELSNQPLNVVIVYQGVGRFLLKVDQSKSVLVNDIVTGFIVGDRWASFLHSFDRLSDEDGYVFWLRITAFDDLEVVMYPRYVTVWSNTYMKRKRFSYLSESAVAKLLMLGGVY